MTSRQSRSASIPIPRSVAAAAAAAPPPPTDPLFFSLAAARPRLPSVHAAAARRTGADDHRLSLGARANSVFGGGVAAAASGVAAPRSPGRVVSHASVLTVRPTARPTSTFEPRVIRADTARSPDSVCLPSTSSTSPTRARRTSGAGTRAPSAQRGPAAPGPAAPPAPFPRPAYLEHSALRHLLHTEASGALLPPRGKADISVPDAAGADTRGRTLSPPTDSDEESNPSPPRAASPAPAAAGTAAALPSSEAVMRLPTRWSEQYRHPSLTVSADGRDLTYHGAPSSGDKDAAAARTTFPVPPACGIYYYEVEILSKGQKGHISIGFAGKDVRLSRLPGWEKQSWGYHGDDGYSFSAEQNGQSYGPTFGTNDVIGCGVDFSQNKLFYTKNGSFLGMVFDNVGRDGDIYPSVGLRHASEAVRVNFGHEPFKFDIDDHVLQARNAAWHTILATPCALHDSAPPPPLPAANAEADEEDAKRRLNDLVLAYLAHHGYARAARALQTQSGRQDCAATPAPADGAAPLPVPPPRTAPAPDDAAMDTDGPARARVPQRAAGPVEADEIEARTAIVGAVTRGDVEGALAALRARHAGVLAAEDGLVLFKLRCRQFLELFLEAEELKQRMQKEREGGGAVGADGDFGDGDGEGHAAAMDVDDDADGATKPVPPPGGALAASNGFAAPAPLPLPAHRPSPPTRSPLAASYEAALEAAIAYGRRVQADYGGDARPEVAALFRRTFGVLAYREPLAPGSGAAEVLGAEARLALANEVNRAILKSQGRPAHPALERIYRQAAACVAQLGLMGVGAAAFLDMQREFLEA